MSGKIFVHIGLPKTATTTLQTDFFPQLSDSGVTYIGVKQPREEVSQIQLFKDFYTAVSQRRGIEQLRSKLISQLESGKILLISEEMFTVSANGMSFRDKLENLKQVLAGLNYTILLTVREPTAAMFSYFVERQVEYRKKYRNFNECAVKEESMQIFHYNKLVKELFSRFEKERVFAFRFEEIVRSDSGVLERIAQLITNKTNSFKAVLPARNARNRDSGHIHVQRSISFSSIVLRALKRIGITTTRLEPVIKYVKPIAQRLDKLIVRKTKIALPTGHEQSLLKEYLRDETPALEHYFGIKYE